VLIVASVLVACAASKEAVPTFPGKNGKIAFASTRDGKTGGEDIYAMDPGGTSVERLTDHPQGDFEPAWSPDGSKIAFARYRHGNPEIYTMRPNGTSVKRLTDDPKADLEPAWSPDGSKIAFTSDRHSNPSAVEASQDPRSNYEIYAMDADGTAVERLTNNAWGDFNPDWQPLPLIHPSAWKGRSANFALRVLRSSFVFSEPLA
jgi:TolB protein